MQILLIIILGVIQGLTEFLPVSSSGHLVLMQKWFGLESNAMMLTILLHVATLLAVLIYYRKDVIELILHPFCPTNRKILLTTLCTCMVVLVIKPLVDMVFEGDYLFIFFIITAMLLILSDFLAERRLIMSRTRKTMTYSDTMHNNSTPITNLNISYKQAVIIGLTQGIACIPGISRSGSTIAVARMCGIDDSATKYSFLISIPIILASLLLEIISGGSIADVSIIGISISMVVCLILGLLCIKIMCNFVNKNKLSIFSYYLIVLSIILIFFG